MQQKSSANRRYGEEREARRIDEDRFTVPSFTEPERFSYEVDLARLSCTCPRVRNGYGRCVKHVVAADAIEHLEKTPRYRAARTEEYREMQRERVFRLVVRVFEPVKRGESVASSYELLCEVLAARTTEAVRRAAEVRHRMVRDGETGKVA